MSSEQLADGVNPLDAELAATWDILKGYSGRNTDLGIARRFGGAAAAYSLRDIGAMNGRVVEVRRSSDNAVEDFSANQVASGAVEAFVGGSNSGFVSKWYDQSGNGLDMVQTTTADQPRIVNSGTLETIDGKPTIKFLNVGTNLGSTFLQNSSPISLPTAMTAFFVTSATIVSGTRMTFSGGTADFAFDEPRLELRRGGTNLESTLTLSSDTNSLLVYNNNSSFLTRFDIDDSTETKSGITGTDGESSFQFLGENSSSASNDIFGLQGTMSEVILYTIDLDSEITDVKNEINNFYQTF